MVHPLAVAANRSQQVTLVRSNLFGFAAPAIAATESAYEEMWATDVGAMAAYHGGASAAAAQLAPWQQLAGSLPGLGSSAAAAATKAPFTGFGGIGQVEQEITGSFGAFQNYAWEGLAQAAQEEQAAAGQLQAVNRQVQEDEYQGFQVAQTELRQGFEWILEQEQLAQQAAEQALLQQIQERLKLSWFS
jgi:PPE-repeat protein